MAPDRFRAVLTACQFVMANYRVETDNDLQLMLRHKQMRDKILKKSLEPQQEYSISFDDAELLDFWLLWMRIELSVFEPYEANVMQEILNMADQYKETIKRKYTVYENEAQPIETNSNTRLNATLATERIEMP